MKKSNAFTLAEVLITLGIIGVVAAMTIPTLMNKTNDNELKVAWKKAYSELNQASISVLEDNGGTFKGLCNNMDYICFKNSYLSYLKVSKNCDSGFFGNCWNAADKFWSMNGGTTGWGEGTGLITSSGYFVGFYYYAKNCDMSWIAPQICGEIIVDVNGFKKPNVVGKDIFLMEVLDKKLNPEGNNDSAVNSCNSSSDGRGCSALYLYDK